MSEENKETVTVGLEKVPLKTEREEKRNKRKHTALITGLLILFLVVGFGLGCLFVYKVHPVNKADATNTMGEIEALLNRYWIYSNDYEDFNKTLEDKAFYGMTTFEEDPYTTYMSNDELNEFSTSINMDYVGIGVQYSLNNNTAIIERVFANSPAERAGILAGDIIVKVDGQSIDGLTTEQIKEMVIGEEGSKVVISILRDNKPMDFEVIRNNVDSSVYCYNQDDYIVMELSSFGVNTGKDIIEYLNQYEDYHKIIIDLRNNSGGYQNSVKEIAGLFIGNGEVYLRQKDKDGNEVADLTNCSKTYTNFDKYVLLVNNQTASAAEVFTICLKEKLDNVTIVGDTTYGKGVIQSTNYLLNGGVLKYTTFNWYSPNGVSIHKTGIKPDVPVRQADIAYEYLIHMGEDESYKYDEVSSVVAFGQKALSFLGYDIDRTDGYFDKSFETALIKYKTTNKLDNEEVLDYKTYEALTSSVISELSNKDKDYQFNKAIELIQE